MERYIIPRYVGVKGEITDFIQSVKDVSGRNPMLSI